MDLSTEITPCLRCQGEMKSGRLIDYAGTQFLPDGLPLGARITGRVVIAALMCSNCGHIELRGDVEKLRKSLQR